MNIFSYVKTRRELLHIYFPDAEETFDAIGVYRVLTN
jgi:hypothetical protein